MFLDILINNLHQSLFRYDHVLNYLHSREVTDEDIKKYKIGYNNIVRIPEDSDPEREYFLKSTRNGHKIEGKIIFPYQDALGRIIGFLGRSVEAKEYKVFVTEEAKFTGFFFGLFQALPYIYEQNRAYIVEGPFDQMALAKVLPNTVASLTAGLSDAQYDFLRFYCDEIITVFDSDKTGRYATEKALERKNVQGMELGSYKDPARCLEMLKLSKFRKFILEKILIL